MAEVDWRNLNRTSSYHFYAVSQTNPDIVLGEIEGVETNGCSITAGYYTDARVSGSIKVVGEGWPRGSFIRITHEIEEFDYERTLGTFLVADDDADLKDGAWTYSLDLRSMLYAMSLDLAPEPWTIATNAYSLSAFKQICSGAGRKYIDLGATNARLKTPLVLEPGKSQLSRIYALAELGNNRIDVDGLGNVTIDAYENPARKAATFTISDSGDARGLMFDNLKRATDYLSTPNRAAVSYKYTTQNGKTSTDHYITGVADATGALAASARGYRVTEFESISEMNPANGAQAQRLAAEKLAENSSENLTFTCSVMELPIWAGDVINLEISTGLEEYRGLHKCLIQTLDFNFDGTLDLTLKSLSKS